MCRAEDQAYYNLLNNADHPSIHLTKETRDYIYKTTGEYLVDIRVPNLVHNDIIHRVTTDALKRQINKLEQQLATESLSELERKDIIRAIQVLKAQQQGGVTPEYFKELVNSLRETWTQITAKK